MASLSILPWWAPSLALASNALMEFVKPAISWRVLQKTILENLDDEFQFNFAMCLETQKIMEASAAGMIDAEGATISMKFMNLNKNRSDYYEQNEKAAFYGLRYTTSLLGTFYSFYEENARDFQTRQISRQRSELGKNIASYCACPK
jgi:hypothetical protein